LACDQRLPARRVRLRHGNLALRAATGALSLRVSDAVSSAARAAHDLAVHEGRPTYLDPETGFTVFTAVSLLAQGRCCGSGCRHCPYGEDEQRRAGRPTST
jgi:hypothetical protein